MTRTTVANDQKQTKCMPPAGRDAAWQGPVVWFPEVIALIVLVECSVFPDAWASGIISMVTLAAYLVFHLIANPAFFLKYLPYMFAVVANVVGCFVCEYTEVSLYEISTTSGFVGSLPLLIFSRWVFVAFLVLFDRLWGVRISEAPGRDGVLRVGAPKSVLLKVAVAVEAIAIVALFVHVAPTPSFSVGLDRFNYAALYQRGIWDKLDYWAAFGAIFLVVMLRWGNKRWRLVSALALAVYCLFMFWTGEKFGGFFTIVCMFGFVFYDKVLMLDRRQIGRFIVGLLFGGALLVVLAVFAHDLAAGGRGPTQLDYLNARLAQQGQLWWKTYDNSDGQTHVEDFDSEIRALRGTPTIRDSVGADNGIYRIMYYTAPQGRVDAKLASGSRYTEAGYASAYYYFGAAGPVAFSLIMGLVIALIQNGLIRAIWQGDPIRQLLFVRFVQIARGAISMFILSTFVSGTSLLALAYLVVAAVVRMLAKDGEALGKTSPLAGLRGAAARLDRWYNGAR